MRHSEWAAVEGGGDEGPGNRPSGEARQIEKEVMTVTGCWPPKFAQLVTACLLVEARWGGGGQDLGEGQTGGYYYELTSPRCQGRVAM